MQHHCCDKLQTCKYKQTMNIDIVFLLICNITVVTNCGCKYKQTMNIDIVFFLCNITVVTNCRCKYKQTMNIDTVFLFIRNITVVTNCGCKYKQTMILYSSSLQHHCCDNLYSFIVT